MCVYYVYKLVQMMDNNTNIDNDIILIGQHTCGLPSLV